MTLELTPDAPKTWTAPRAKTLLFALIAAMYLYVLWTNESFLFDKSNPEWKHIAPFQMILLPHGLIAGVALFLGPFQFSERLRRNHIMVHKTMGYLYITGVYLGAPIGIYIQWFQERFGGIETRSFTIATVVDAAIWIFATTMALIFVRQRKIQQHRIWMTRSFACALIFLEVRAISTLFHVPEQYLEAVVWGCVATAFPLADLVMQIDEVRRSRSRMARA